MLVMMVMVMVMVMVVHSNDGVMVEIGKETSGAED
jgi:hypothetical protein